MQPQLQTTRSASLRRRLAAMSLAVAGLMVLGACTGTGSGGGVIYFTNFTAGYVPGSLAASHPLLVETYGVPTPGLTQESVTRASVQGLRSAGPPWMPRGYTGNPDDVPNPAYRLRIAYGVPRAFNGQRLCEPEMSSEALEGARTQADANAVRTLAGLCRGKNAIAYAEGSPGASPDIAGERFERFIGLLGRELMPRRNPVTEDDCIFRFCD